MKKIKFDSKEAIIFDVRSFSINDGPGIRTTVFFKGCPLSCIWCHNPEGLLMKPEIVFRSSRCHFQEHICQVNCPHNSIVRYKGRIIIKNSCQLCMHCVQNCPSEAFSLIGASYSLEELVSRLQQDELFFRQSGGGVTFSGGEPLMQSEFLIDLLDLIKRKYSWHTAVDTCGYVNQKILEKIVKSSDLFLFDLKLIDDHLHQKYTGVSNKIILDNFSFLVENGANLQVRIPLIPEITASKENISAIANFLSRFQQKFPISLLNYHRSVQSKYQMLNRDYLLSDLKPLSLEQLENIKSLLANVASIFYQGE